MKIKDLISTDRILLDQDIKSKKSLFYAISDWCNNIYPEVDKKTLFGNLISREKLGNTDIGNGVALPHTQIEDIPGGVIFIVRLRKPIDYDAFDEQPIWLAASLITPPDEKEQHSLVLAKLLKILDDKEVQEKIKNTDNPEYVLNLIVGRE